MNKAALITVGTELLIGQVIDSNGAWIGQQLNHIGIHLVCKLTVSDNQKDIGAAIDYARKNASIIIVSGGLGTTSDDMTKQAIATYIGESSYYTDQSSLHKIEKFLHDRGKEMNDRYREQAMIPSGCKPISNDVGLAPGIWFSGEYELIAVPGVPSEMKAMLAHEVLSLLASKYGGYVEHKYLLTSGLGETMVAERLQHFEQKIPDGITLSYLPAKYVLRLRLTAVSANNDQSLHQNLLRLHEELVEILKDISISTEDVSIQEALATRLLKQNKTLSTAESCTGGYLSHLITSIPGSSVFYKGSIIAYAYEVKKEILHVSEHTLNKYGAVSEPTVAEMLKGLLKEIKTDYGVAISGIMGPGGGTKEKPLGTVCIAVGNQHRQIIKTHQLRSDRMQNIIATTNIAIVMLIRLMDEESTPA